MYKGRVTDKELSTYCSGWLKMGKGDVRALEAICEFKKNGGVRSIDQVVEAMGDFASANGGDDLLALIAPSLKESGRDLMHSTNKPMEFEHASEEESDERKDAVEKVQATIDNISDRFESTDKPKRPTTAVKGPELKKAVARPPAAKPQKTLPGGTKVAAAPQPAAKKPAAAKADDPEKTA